VAGGVVTLGDLASRIELLEIRCKRCERQGRVRLSRLIEEHGAGRDLPSLGTRLAAGCPRSTLMDGGARCFIYYPQLLRPT
jgi:hypothetical protein